MTHPAIGRIACRPTCTDATREGHPVRAALTTPHRAARVLLSLVPAALLAVALAPDRAVSAQQVQAPVPGALAALGSPPNPRVPMHWDRFYDHKGIGEILHRIAAAWPDRARVSSIGKSVQGRDIWMITVTNFNHGDPDRKPAMYIDGNIHSNEIQGSEFAMYTAWYLTEMADSVSAVDSLLDDRVLYIVPTINPDARDHFIHQPNTASSPRTGLAPRDNDGDGVIDEDGLDDLDGDGNITQMRRRNPNGRLVTSPVDPRIMIPAPQGQSGEWEMLGREGIDNDGDGEVNEDADGGYDPNRNWPWRWQPQYVQRGSDYYPTSLPETQAVMNFVLAHENIAGAQSYHNNGGMILRGPGVPQDEYRPQDVRVYDVLGQTGEQILPGYRYMIVWKDLYTAWGGELDWFYGGRGIITFSNELWTSFLLFDRPPDRTDRSDPDDYRFDRLLLMRQAFVPWKPFNHPQYGPVEIGGFKKNWGRVEPGFLLQADAHRNMMFTLFQTWNLPMVRVDSIASRSLGNGLTEVTAIIANRRLVPTHTQQDVENRITRPDWVSLEGGTVVAGFVVTDELANIAREQKRNPQRIEVDNVPGMGTVTVRWIVRGSGPFHVTVDSWKGGVHRR
jgi:hypothetical protein